MRRLFINGKFYAGGLNGVHRVADRLVRELDRQSVAGQANGGEPATLLVPPGCEQVPDLANIRIKTIGRRASQAWEQFLLPAVCEGAVLLSLANLAPVLHRRNVMLVHDIQFRFPDCSYPPRQRLGYNMVVPLAARRAAVATVSEYSRQMLDLVGIKPRAGVEVIHNGLDHVLDVEPERAVLGRLGVQPDGYVLLFGSTKTYKNVDVVLRAFGRGGLVGLRLVVVGPSLEQLAAEGLPIPAAAVSAGACSDAELRALYENAVALAFPSRTEGFGLPPGEAMLCGCPVVVSPAGAIPEVCGDAASYASVDAPEEWEAAILQIAGDLAFRRARIAAGQKRATAFTWRMAGGRLGAVIDRARRS
jgi:glycosyltransferase involved in cell wall biosynthesis